MENERLNASIDSFWKWFDAKRNEALATQDGKAFAESGMEITHTGGGFVAWEFSHGESYVWVTDDDGTGLFTTPENTGWTVGYYRECECIDWKECQTVADAIEQAKAYRAIMQKTVLNFAEFQNSRTMAYVSSDEQFEEIAGGCIAGFKYAGSSYIACEDDGSFMLTISNWSESSRDLTKMERILWSMWYLTEQENVTLSVNDTTLDDYLVGWCDYHGIACDGDLYRVLFAGQDSYTLDEVDSILSKQHSK
jgi:hypothetical protein